MSINITHTMNTFNFEGRENLRNTARDILNRQGASNESMQKIIDETIFDAKQKNVMSSLNPQLAIIKASSQITMNNSMKETLKYLKSQAMKKTKKTPVLGELWDTLASKEEEIYTGELIDFEINSELKNIFAAA